MITIATTTNNSSLTSLKARQMQKIHNLRSSIYFTMVKIIEQANVKTVATEKYKEPKGGVMVPDFYKRNQIAEQVLGLLKRDMKVARNLAKAYKELGELGYHTNIVDIKDEIVKAEKALSAGYDLRRLSNKNLNIHGSKISSANGCGS